MSGRYLLDANIIIALFAQEAAVHERLTTAEEVFVPCVAVGELYFGAYKSLRAPENLSRIDEFAVDNLVLSCTADTARKYGEIKNRLKEKGQPIPENDIWIAAIARQHGLTLVTRDAHFDAVENLNVEVW